MLYFIVLLIEGGLLKLAIASFQCNIVWLFCIWYGT